MLDDKIQDSLRMIFLNKIFTPIYTSKVKPQKNFPNVKYGVWPAHINYIKNIHPWAVNIASTTPKLEPKHKTRRPIIICLRNRHIQARNQDFMWGGANEAKVDQTTEMYFLLSDPFI